MPRVKLVGEDGNAFNILGRCLKAARRAGWSPEQVRALQQDMTAGNYDHLLQVAAANFEVE
jgi:hypothetical protein